jgi:hypothetical protein
MPAELKMHIRDEHAHKETIRQLELKHVFRVRTGAEQAAATLAVPPVSNGATPGQFSANLPRRIFVHPSPCLLTKPPIL